MYVFFGVKCGIIDFNMVMIYNIKVIYDHNIVMNDKYTYHTVSNSKKNNKR